MAEETTNTTTTTATKPAAKKPAAEEAGRSQAQAGRAPQHDGHDAVAHDWSSRSHAGAQRDA